MGTLKLPPLPDDGAMADLEEMDHCLAGLLPPLLLGRFSSDVLHRWARLRCWVTSAQEGDWVLALDTMHAGVENLAAIIEQRFRGSRWTDTHPRSDENRSL